MIQKRRLVSSSKKLYVFKRDKYTCQYCGVSGSEIDLECDHIYPVSKGGTNDITNLTTSCRTCNRKKSDSVDWDLNNVNNDFIYFWDTRKENYVEREVNLLQNKDILLGFYKINKSDVLKKEIFAYKLNIHDELNPHQILKLNLTDTQILSIKYYYSYQQMSNDYAQKAWTCNRIFAKSKGFGVLPLTFFELPIVNKY